MLNSARDKNIIGMYRRRLSSPPPLPCDPGWVVKLVVVGDRGQWGTDDRKQ